MFAYLNGRESMNYNRSVIYMLYFATNSLLTYGLDHLSDGTFFCTDSTLSSSSGTLFSENYPSNYNHSLYCEANISINNAMLIDLSFEYFNTESYLNLNLLNNMCNRDYLEISVNERSWRVCGDWTGKENRLFFSLNSSTVNLKFRSNEFFSRQGFVLKWTSTLKYDLEDQSSCSFSKFLLLESQTSCFEFFMQPTDWLSGHESCRERGASLARIEDIQTQTEIETSLQKRQLHNSAIWIGAHDRLFEGDYMWTDRSSIQYTNWFPGWMNFIENKTHDTSQPSDDGYSNEDCVEIRRLFSYPGKGTGLTKSFFWNDRNCEEKNPFICQFDKHIQKRSPKPGMTECGEMVELTAERPTVVVTSPGFPSNYPELVSCHTVVKAPKDKQIYVDFSYFNIEDSKACEFDNVTIFEPRTNKTNEPLCGYWNQKLKLLRLVSVSDEIVITFHSDNSKQFKGFKVQLSILDPVIMCLGDIPNISTGNLGDTPLSTTVAAVYSNNECLIILNDTKTFPESVTSCETFDAKVANIATSTMQIVAQVLEVGNDCVEVWSSLENSVTTAISDSQLINNGMHSTCNATRICQTITQEGFLSTMNHTVEGLTVPCSNRYQTVCRKSRKNSTVVNFTSQAGNFAQLCPEGKNYTNDVMLVQNFIATSGYRIIFELHSFDLEFQERCLYDYVRTSGMVKNHRFCGKSVRPVSFISERETASLEFNTDSDVTACGFNVSWHWIKTGEAFHIRFIKLDKHGFITSVNYPDEFPDRIDSCTNIAIPKDNRMLLEIHNLTLPGENCDDTMFTISSESKNIHAFCGGYSMAPKPLLSNQLVLLESGKVRFCLNANSLKAMDGVKIEFEIVPTINTTISTTLTLSPDEDHPISSLMYPELIPSLLMQEMTFRTQIGYKIHVELNITILRTDNCSEDSVRMIDNSLKSEGGERILVSCKNLTNETVEGIENVRFSSVLNSVKIQGLTGTHRSGASSLCFVGIVKSIKDPDYLDITKRVHGSFDACLNTTCLNGGVCSDALDNRFKCECSPRYTGLFCQANKCELNPCQHGLCNLTDTGFQCTCDPNYWGELCDMNNAVCRMTKCSGNGECVAFNNRDYRCLCNQQYTGSKCNIPILRKDQQKNMTIGQKLLKEPIWIGMIVIVNLVIFFCISYVIRRKCGRKISKLFPKRNKASVNASKENSKGEPSTFSNGNSDQLSGRNVYSITLETPKASSASLWSARRKVYRENLDSISAPSTPVVTEQNQDAAMKLFASYNSRRDQLTPTITSLPTNTSPDFSRTTRNIMSCGIKGGTLTLNRDDDFEHNTNDITHGILRSYTVSTEIRDFESRRSKLRKEIPHKASSYSGSPFRSGSTGYFEQHSPNGPNDIAESAKQRHCYPEIRIINENNIEEIKKSDSETSDIDGNPDDVDMNNIHAADTEVKPVENIDSGYPSTTMSNTTHSESVLTESGEIKVEPTASEKRKMFGSKSKSASFYKLGAVEVSGNILHKEHRNPNDISSAKSHNPSIDKCMSFESDRCSSCHRETIDRCAYSYDKDVDKFHKYRVRQLSHDVSRYCSRHKRHKRKRYGDCRHHSQNKDSYHPRPLLLPKSHSHNESCIHFNSRHQRLTDTQRYGRGSRVLNSSTESDSCLCSNYDSRYHLRKNNRKTCIIKEAFSESDCHQRQSFDRRPRNRCETHLCQDLKSEDSYKSNLMKSFLSDTYHAKYNGYSGYSFISEETLPGPAIFPSYPSSSSSMDATPSKHAQLHANLSRRSDTVLERSDESVLRLDVSPSLPNSDNSNVSFTCSDSYAMRESRDIGINIDDLDRSTQSAMHYSPQRNHSLYIENYAGVSNKSDIEETDENCQNFTEEVVSKQSNALTKLKDSAYQTKQSSLDRFRGDRSFSTSGSVKTRTKSIEKTSSEDMVRRHLHQAALKLALLKRLQNGREVSKDSAVNTFSEEDISADEKEPRGTFRPLVKKTSGSLAFQLGQMSLSEVKEEHSGGLSKDTESYNTPNNEPVIDSALEHVVGDTTVVSMKEMHEITKPKCVIDSIHMDETKV